MSKLEEKVNEILGIDKSEPKKFVRKQIESYAQRNSIKSTRSNQ